jgi:hypothetical protein
MTLVEVDRQQLTVEVQAGAGPAPAPTPTPGWEGLGGLVPLMLLGMLGGMAKQVMRRHRAAAPRRLPPALPPPRGRP